jgi:diguanylate cyclase (GGDEF)-like protein
MPLSLLIVDLDHFKQVNDLHGHRGGDDVLTEAARRIARASPRGAVVARIGGDEFTVLHTMSSSEALAVADGIRAEFAAPMEFVSNLTVSIGCATVTVPGQSLFTPADEALYTAKARGRNSVVHYDEILRRARDENRDPALEGFENRTRVIAQRVAELISDRGRRIFGELKKQADVDVLTGLYSRRYLDRRLPVELDVSSERDAPLTIALLDIDHFGNVNKTYGWPSGDKVLNEVAARVRANIRSEDWAARYGGEEVCVVMHGTPLDVARPVLERVRTAVAEAPFLTTNGQEVEITVSGGAAERDGAESLETLMERVSQRLLLAKRGGRNRLVT